MRRVAWNLEVSLLTLHDMCIITTHDLAMEEPTKAMTSHNIVTLVSA